MDIIIRRWDNTVVSTVSAVLSCTVTEKLSHEKTLTFETLLTDDLERVNDTEQFIAEYDSEFYDITKVKKSFSGGQYKIAIDCEHVSYRLSDYTKTAFSKTGTVREILEVLVRLTGFQVGNVEPTDTVTYTMGEDKSKRAAILDFCSVFGYEADFDGFYVHILNHKGKTEVTDFFDRNVLSVSKTVKKASSEKSYACSVYAPSSVGLGDEVHLSFKKLDIDEDVRIVGVTRNPFTSNEVKLEVENYADSVESDLVRLETSSVIKGKQYYGVAISTDKGLDITREDGKAEVVMNADEFTMRASDSDGNLQNRIYFDPSTGEYRFVGTVKIDGGEINIGNNFRVDQDGNAYLAGDATIYGGKYYAGIPGEADGFSQMTADGFEVYNGNSEIKLRFGYTSEGEDYPFIQLGSGSGTAADYGLVKKFDDGLWIGNSEPSNESGEFEAKTGYNGIFFRFSDNTAFIVQGTTMKNIYTGAAIAKFG